MILGTGARTSNSNCGTALAVFLLLCLCVNSWGACVTGSCEISGAAYYCGSAGAGVNDITCGSLECAQGSCAYLGTIVRWGGDYTSKVYARSGGNKYCVIPEQNAYYSFSYIKCDTQAEADSVACENDPTLPNCAVTKDTLLFACSESLVNGQAVATIYKLSCKATNGSVTECNGKQNVDIATDGQPVKQMQGTCAQNGIPNGVFGGSDVQDSTELPNGANADCFAITGSKCHMKDKVSGNTFTCDCDGSCQVAIQNLMAGSASCTNPYPQPTSSSDSLNLGSSGSGGESSPSSSGSEGGSSPSSSPADSTGDFEYDYNAVLEAIRANTQYTGSEVNRLNGKADEANDYLRQIANKDFSPTINVGGPNITLDADTATAPAKIYNFMKDTSGLQGFADQFNAQKAVWSRFADSVKSAVAGYLDTIVAEDSSWVKQGRDIDSMVSVTGTNFRAYMDTIENSPFNDTLNRWVGMIVNNGVISGSGNNNCPSLLTRHHVLTIGQVSVDVGSLGGQLCTPIAGLNVTLWAVARAFLRFVVAFGCMVWIYCEVVGVKTTGEDD